MWNKIFEYVWIQISRTGFVLNSFWIYGIWKITLIVWKDIYINFNWKQFYNNRTTVYRILSFRMSLMSHFLDISASIYFVQLLKNKITHDHKPILINLRSLEVYIRRHIIVWQQKLIWLVNIHWCDLFLTVDRTRPLFIFRSILTSIFLPFRNPINAHDVPNFKVARQFLLF